MACLCCVCVLCVCCVCALCALLYRWVARGFYGGNLTLVFAPADEGSGIDAKFANHYACPVPGHEAGFCAVRRQLADGTRPPARDTSRPGFATKDDPDAGELRTPNYKPPVEVLGADVYAWNREHTCAFPSLEWPYTEPGCNPTYWQAYRQRYGRGLTGCDAPYVNHSVSRTVRCRGTGRPDRESDAPPFDLSMLQRPLEWAFRRVGAGTHEAGGGARATSSHMAYVLAPTARAEAPEDLELDLQGGDEGRARGNGEPGGDEARGGAIYGVEYDQPSNRYLASRPPPAVAMADIRASDDVAYMTADLPPPTSRPVAVAGVLYTCARTNLLDDEVSRNTSTSSGAPQLPEQIETADGANDGSSLCAAVRAMRPHAAASAAGVTMTHLPESLATQLASLRIWPADTTIALEDGLKRPTVTQLHVCMLSAHAARTLDAHC